MLLLTLSNRGGSMQAICLFWKRRSSMQASLFRLQNDVCWKSIDTYLMKNSCLALMGNDWDVNVTSWALNED